MGAGSSVMGFAYYYGAASVIASAKRALNILFAVLSGNIYFHEKEVLGQDRFIPAYRHRTRAPRKMAGRELTWRPDRHMALSAM